MRIAAIADLHGHLPPTPESDVLVIAGDLVPFGLRAPEEQVAWLDGPFREWLAAQPARRIVGIAGNHDFVFQEAPELVPDLPWTYLQDAGCEIDGVRFWGSPWQPWFFDWAFNAPKEDGEAFLAERFALVPEDVDVLVVHGPPRGYGDRAAGDGSLVGSVAQLECIDRVGPAACVFGHIHEGRGRWTRGTTELANVSAVDVYREPVDDPVVVLDVPSA